MRSSILSYGAKNLYQVFLDYKERYQHRNVWNNSSSIAAWSEFFLGLIHPAVVLETLSQAVALRELLQSGWNGNKTPWQAFQSEGRHQDETGSMGTKTGIKITPSSHGSFTPPFHQLLVSSQLQKRFLQRMTTLRPVQRFALTASSLLHLSGVFKQSKQWTLFSQRFAHGPHAEGPEIPPADTSTFIQLTVKCWSRDWLYNVLLQELVKHTTDLTDKENLRIALDAMRVSVCAVVCIYSLFISADLACVSRTWRRVSTRWSGITRSSNRSPPSSYP